MKRRLSRDTRSMWITAYLFLLPAAALWVIWFLIPAVQSFRLSFYEYNYAVPINNHFVGLDNYVKLFQNRNFYQALQHTIIIVGVAVPAQTIISLFLAVCINLSFKGRGIYRTIFFMPHVISSIAVATVFMYLFVRDKTLPVLLSHFGLDNVSWFADTRYALPFIILMYVWQQVGFYMIIYLSGLQTISREVQEAAQIDGANGWRQFRFITVPILKPVTFLVLTHGAISSFQIFDQIAAVSGQGQLGSPAGSISTLVTFFYLNSFKFGEVGFGSATAVVLFVLILAITILQKRLFGKDD
ncbi:carbohydrate ABC transporter permease [Paenibacillus sp. J2TS4]|uniref:carbohydrate ABC transporter permease n=1 Tax=Paenibacillus sp. J2TS4 TaxID=2807194 RepID=UPI001B1D4260|nr:sugar ABC transporter permease [Paenibacillus sp. J2TS4]GIP30970.1 ABC transporter permease [Paenibacillus sp. J2TS4]